MIRKVILFSGTRKGVDVNILHKRLDYLLTTVAKRSELVIIHGAALGVDSQVEAWCERNGIHSFTCKARWKSYDKPAGNLRNEAMVNLIKIINNPFVEVLVEAFPPVGNEGGTRHLVKVATEAGFNVSVYEYKL